MKYILLLLCVIYIKTTSFCQSDSTIITINGSSDVLLLTKKTTYFELKTNLKNQTFHITLARDLRPVTGYRYSSGHAGQIKFQFNRHQTGDRIVIHVRNSVTDSLFYSKIFYIINEYEDSLRREKIRGEYKANRDCIDKIKTPKYNFYVYVDDEKINTYEIEWFGKELYLDTMQHIDCEKQGNIFKMSKKYNYMSFLLRIGKFEYMYDLSQYSYFCYGASLYFSISTNDKKLYRKYKKYDECLDCLSISNYINTLYIAIANQCAYYKNLSYDMSELRKRHSILTVYYQHPDCIEANRNTFWFYDSVPAYTKKDLR